MKGVTSRYDFTCDIKYRSYLKFCTRPTHTHNHAALTLSVCRVPCSNPSTELTQHIYTVLWAFNFRVCPNSTQLERARINFFIFSSAYMYRHYHAMNVCALFHGVNEKVLFLAHSPQRRLLSNLCMSDTRRGTVFLLYPFITFTLVYLQLFYICS